MGKVQANESLLATDTEKHATSKSLYGDNKGRISGNVASLHDRLRMNAYKPFVLSMKGQRLLHLSCGIGLLSMIAARGGAKQVIGLDTSSIVEPASVVAEQNGLSKGQLEFRQGVAQDIFPLESLPVEESDKFDGILCEWFGQFLTNDDALKQAIYCRDHLLKKGGVICPSRATLSVVGITDYEYFLNSMEFWDDVYGFAMKPMKQLVAEDVSVSVIPAESIITSTCVVHTVEIMTVTEETCGFTADFVINATKHSTVHYLTLYVDAGYTALKDGKHDASANFQLPARVGGRGRNLLVEVSLLLSKPIPVEVGDVIKGTVKVTPPAKGERAAHVDITAHCEGKVAKVSATGTFHFY